MRGTFLNQCLTSCINAQYEQQKFTCTYILFKKLLLSFTKTDLRGSLNKSCLYLQHCVCCRDQKPDQGPRKVYCTNSNSSRTPGSVPGCKTDPAWRTGNESLIPPTFDLPWPLPFTQRAILFFSCTVPLFPIHPISSPHSSRRENKEEKTQLSMFTPLKTDASCSRSNEVAAPSSISDLTSFYFPTIY